MKKIQMNSVLEESRKKSREKSMKGTSMNNVTLGGRREVCESVTINVLSKGKLRTKGAKGRKFPFSA